MPDFIAIEGFHHVNVDSLTQPHGGARVKMEKCYFSFAQIRDVIPEDITPGSETVRVEIRSPIPGRREWVIVGGTVGGVASQLGLI